TSTHISNKSLHIGTLIIAVAATVAMLYYGRDFFVTLIISAAFAFLLDPAVVLVTKLRIPRPAATAIVLVIALVALYFVAVLAGTQISTLKRDLPAFTSRLGELVDKTNKELDQIEQQTIATLVPSTLRKQDQQIQEKPQEAMRARRRRSGHPPPPVPQAPPQIQEVRIHTDPRPVLASVYSYVSGYFHALLMASFVPVLVYFMLSWRDHITKGVLRLFPGHERYAVGRSWSGIADSTRAFVLGNFFLWILLSVLSSAAFFFLRVPYWLLIGPISSFFSLIPYVGLPLSVLPPLLSALAIPNKFKIILLLVAITAMLHILAMNFLYAKIVGRRVRLNPLAVTVALMFWGSLWGGIGLILAIPVTAAIKAVCDNVETLEPYGRLLGD
ncbi:MAG TPA: AI-2E family transporter, partial [Bryobacteraceae bacterium]